MPSGGGAAGGCGGGGGIGGGGGGFGGGGFGGGGFAGGGVYAGQRGGNQGDPRVVWGVLCCSLTCGLIIVLAIVLPIVLPAVVSNSSSSSTTTPDIATDFYSPGDSRLHSFSSFFCESITAVVDSTDTGVSLALVNSPPLLTDQNNFTIADQRTLRSRRFRFWQYHLYPNSNISISICNTVGRSNQVNAYLVKGNSNANNWGQSPSSVHAELFRSVRGRCPQRRIITYNVKEEDEYYVFLYNPQSTSSISYSATLQFERFEYALPPDNASVDSCSAPAPGGQCTVDIPYGTGSQLALVVTTIPENVNWGENVDVSISCNRRDWAYAIVILLPILVIIAVIVCIVTSICICCYKYKAGK